MKTPPRTAACFAPLGAQIASTRPGVSTALTPPSLDQTSSVMALVSLDSWPTQHQMYASLAQRDALLVPTQLPSASAAFQVISSGMITFAIHHACQEHLRTLQPSLAISALKTAALVQTQAFALYATTAPF